MSTLPPDSDPEPVPTDPAPTPVETHQARDVAESFGADPDRYDRARPRYPDAMVQRIFVHSPGPDVVDVGCGTGIAARQFQALGCRVTGVEVDPRMAEAARRTGVEAEVAAFEEWDARGRTFDAVVAGQAWHWVDPVAGARKAAAVLRPGGRLAVFWNVFQPAPDLAAAFGEVQQRIIPDAPNVWNVPALKVYAAMFAKAAEGMEQVSAFGEPEEWRYEWEHVYTRDQWLEQVPTFGGSAQLPPEALARLLAGMGAAVDAVGGGFAMKYTTVAVTAVRG